MILRDFRKKIENVINDSGLSIDMVYYVMKDVLNEIEDIYRDTMMKEDAAAAQESLDETKDEEPASAAEDKNQ